MCNNYGVKNAIGFTAKQIAELMEDVYTSTFENGEIKKIIIVELHKKMCLIILQDII